MCGLSAYAGESRPPAHSARAGDSPQSTGAPTLASVVRGDDSGVTARRHTVSRFHHVSRITMRRISVMSSIA